MKNTDKQIDVDTELIIDQIRQYFNSQGYVSEIEQKLWDMLVSSLTNPSLDTDHNINETRLWLYRETIQILRNLELLIAGQPIPKTEW